MGASRVGRYCLLALAALAIGEGIGLNLIAGLAAVAAGIWIATR